MQEQWEPRILTFLCKWCSYAGADLAGTSRLKYPPNLRVIRVPCSGRVDPVFILKALQQGYDMVWVSGCHPGDCHYQSGNRHARRKIILFRRLLELFGISKERVQMSWISAAEGGKFARTADRVLERARELGPINPVERDYSQFSSNDFFTCGNEERAEHE